MYSDILYKKKIQYYTMIKKFNNYSFFIKIYNYNTINFLLNFNKNLFKFYFYYVILYIFCFYFSLCFNLFDPTFAMSSSYEGDISDNSSDSSNDRLNDFEYTEFNLNQSNYLSISTALKIEKLTFLDIMDVDFSTNDIIKQTENIINKSVKKIVFEINLSKYSKEPLDINKVVTILQSANCIEFINNNFLSDTCNNVCSPNELFVCYQKSLDLIAKLLNELSIYQDDRLNDNLKDYRIIQNTLNQKSNQLILSNNLKYFEPFFDNNRMPCEFDKNFQIIKKNY